MKAEFIGVGENWSFTEAYSENIHAFEQELSLLGIEVTKKDMVDNNRSALFYAVRDAIQCSDVIFIIGGLGKKRITHKVLCSGLSLELQHNPDAYQSAQAYFENQSLPIPDYFDRYAKLPEGSLALPNLNGSFCGAVLARKTQCIFSLPEQPDELFPMLLGSVLPYLAEYLDKALNTKSFVVWDSTSAELEETLQIPPDAGYAVAAYRIGQDPARHLVRVSLHLDSSDEKASCIDEILQTLEARLQGFAIENQDQPILQTVVALSLQKRMRIAVAEYATEHALADAIRALPNTQGIYTYNLSECRSEVRKKVFGLPDQSLDGLEEFATETSAYMARGVREVDVVTFGLAVCKQRDHGCTLTATNGKKMLFFADVVPDELSTAAALLLYRFIKAYPASPCEATPLDAIVGKNAPNPRMEKWKAFREKIKEG